MLLESPGRLLEDWLYSGQCRLYLCSEKVLGESGTDFISAMERDIRTTAGDIRKCAGDIRTKRGLIRTSRKYIRKSAVY